VRVRGQSGSDPNSISALEIIVMARTDLEARRHQEQQDWQKRGLGGLITNVDPATGALTISVSGFSGKKEVSIHTTKSTVFRRYAPDSIKFDDSKPSTLAEIHAGDQLRARGDRSPDASQMTAEEVVTGSFRNLAGTINSIDASAGTLSIQDLLTKKAIVVRFSAESQLHKLAPEVAQRIAMRLKSRLAPGAPGEARPAAPGTPAQPRPVQPAETSGRLGADAGTGGGMRAGAAPDFQQLLSRMPLVTLADLHSGDAVLVVATEGSGTSAGIAITLLSGVEPILEAAPNSQAYMLTPWSLGGAPAGDAAQ
jgi:hypothetical protein